VSSFPEAPTPSSDYRTLSEASLELRLPVTTLRRLVRTGSLPAVKLAGQNGSYLVPSAAIEELREKAVPR
jgi:excisionase family DNA binding protein